MKKTYFSTPGALVSALLMACGLGGMMPLFAQAPSSTAHQALTETQYPDTPADPARPPVLLKLSSQLGALYEAGLRPPGVSEAAWKAEMLRLGQLKSATGVPQDTPYGPVDTDLLYVYVNLNDPARFDLVRPFCFGTPDESAEWLLMAAWIEQDRLLDVAALSQVRFIQAVNPPRYRTGSVTSAGDALHNGPQARSAPLSLDGSNIRVGVISNGAVNWMTAAGTGDLPPTVNVPNPGTGDEGTAMMEIIHDLAPGAALDFLPSGSNKIAFGNAIAALAQGGCNIICDDVGWYDDPYFEPSPLGVFINNLRTQHGYLHVSAAGNDAKIHHQQVFTDTAPSDGWHDPVLFVTIPQYGVLDVFMQWKEPLASTPTSDYDLYLYDYSNFSAPIAQSISRSVVGETIYYTNNSPVTITAALFVYRYSGTLAHNLEIFLEPQNTAFMNAGNPVSAVDAIFGHPAHASVISVVATDVANPTVIEADSSQGPVTLYGVLPPPPKPDVAAADGVAVTGVGGFGSPFFGTSAAAPHVAGVLALVWSRSPGADGAAIKASIMNACSDLGSSGFDSVFGYGRPLADQWALLINQAPTISIPTGTFECAQVISEDITGVTVNDPDAGANAVKLTLSSAKGVLQINPTIPGGLTPPQITPTTVDGSPGLIATAPLAAIQTTLAAANGLSYLPNPVPVPPGTPVSDSLLLSLDDQGYSGVGGALTAAATVALQVHQYAFDAWRYDHFNSTELANPLVSGNLADPDGDVHANVWEYFMGTDPKAADAERSPSTTVNSGNLVFTFRVSKDIAGNAYAVKVSQDLVNWSDVPAGQITTPWPQHPTAADAWLMEVKRPLSANAVDFLRLVFDPRP